MSQEQNSPNILNSLPDQGHSVAAVKPFKIREYVLSCQEKNIFNTLPFEKEYLQMCLDRGLTASEVYASMRGISKKFDDLQHDSLGNFVSGGNIEASNSKASKKGENGKMGKGKSKIKKRSIVDILAHTSRFTQEEIDRLYKDWYTLTTNDDHQTVMGEEGSSHQDIVTSQNLSSPDEAQPTNIVD